MSVSIAFLPNLASSAMAQTMESMSDFPFNNLQHSNPTNGEMLQEKYSLDTYYNAIPYHIQSSTEWMLNSPSPSAVSTPSNSPTLPSPHLSSSSLNTNTNGFPSHWPTGPTSSSNSETAQSIKEIQRLTDAKSRRRQQNRESQRAFRERKNRHIEHLEQALADLQHRHEKLLQCFVGLTARVSGENLSTSSNNGTTTNNTTASSSNSSLGLGDLSFLNEPIPQFNLGGSSSGGGGRFQGN